MFMVYALVVVATMIEGEFSMMLVGYLMFNGDLALEVLPLGLAAALGAFLGDWFFFEMGRNRGGAFLQRWQWLSKRLESVAALLARFPLFTLLILRFQIGFRMVGNIILGQGDLNRGRYLVLNAVACLAWATVIIPLCLGFARVIDMTLQMWQY